MVVAVVAAGRSVIRQAEPAATGLSGLHTVLVVAEAEMVVTRVAVGIPVLADCTVAARGGALPLGVGMLVPLVSLSSRTNTKRWNTTAFPAVPKFLSLRCRWSCHST